ncbi:uncharacterized protein EV422DRAFT_354445 [Fimicolochytrium jonesii]|uniref:uncharacterized protein n=1 Tax=Fimicolochytrium jonesii TaxID=1396493 RepID=UPI0022FE4332|nr:uncharacterized protein EV422DRAFT_354445 [Fimicolochytrium jonesii]KAI8823428.1 hypothetical protein EV422DRAFT_354445 [Fimicolochytrium jonesii]
MKEAVQETSRLMQRQLDNEVDCTRNFLSNTSFRNRTSSIDTNLARSDSVNQLSIPSSGGDGALRRRATVAHVPVGIGNQWDTLRRTPSSFDTLELPPTKDYLHVTPSTHLRVTPPFQRARLLLSHLGLIDFDSLRDGELCLLAETPALFRDVKVLDRKHGRETIKVAVIYVAPGQEDEHSIFRNESGSVEYEAFVSSLGWDVDLGSHPGFVGGLERSLANGKTATYFCTSTYEILFHDVTKMPVDQHDAKQLKKKRHIGNDQVHIVWNEHHRDYRRNTIGGDFGNAQIIVTPRTDGLYSIEVLRDEKVPSFGPLHNVTVVSKSILGPLVRQTALNAYRATLAMGDMAAATTMLVGGKQGGKGAVGGTSHTASISSATSISSARTAPSSHAVPLQPRHAFAARREDIVTIADRHKLGKWTFEKFIEAVFATAPEFSTGQQRQECVSSYDFNESPSLGSGESSTSGANERSGPTTLTRIVSGLVA